MDEHRTKEVLDFVLSAYRAKMAVQNPTENCPFDFQSFLEIWKEKALRCEETETEIGPCGADWGALKGDIKRDLQPLAQEGIFDSITPYLASSINQSSAKREEILKERKSDGNGIISTELISLTPRKGQSSKSRRSADRDRTPTLLAEVNEDLCEITIHVCDEGKNIRQDFKCVQTTLVEEMGYFSKVTVKGQKLRDMDISVHCDIAVFDWLMKWVKYQHGEGGDPPQLEASNVIGLMVSADFLQMPLLTEDCLEFTAKNIEDVITNSPNLGCLNESLTGRLGGHFDNLDMENRICKIDKQDRITSRLYTQFILALGEPEGDSARGHFSSMSTLFHCTICGKLLINSIASKVPCGVMRLDSRGRIYSSHQKDNGWSINNFVRELKRELKSWRRVYWRLWGTVHFLHCSICQMYFPARDLGSCSFHPKAPKLSVNVLKATGEIQRDFDTVSSVLPQGSKLQQDKEECINPFRRRSEREAKGGAGSDPDDDEMETINCAFGSYPCCHRVGFKFYPLPQTNGCQFRDHNLSQYGEDEGVLKRLIQLRELIVMLPQKGKLPPKPFEWGGIVDLTPPKLTSSSNSPWVFAQSQNQQRLRFLQQPWSSTEDSGGSVSDGEDPEATSQQQYGQQKPSGGQPSTVSEFWSWNTDFTTRYNQDMQREREEKLMSDLELLLSQRVSLESTKGGSGLGAYGGGFRSFGYLSRRLPKNLGGSFIKLEEKWREEQKVLKSQRPLGKSAKP